MFIIKKPNHQPSSREIYESINTSKTENLSHSGQTHANVKLASTTEFVTVADEKNAILMSIGNTEHKS